MSDLSPPKPGRIGAVTLALIGVQFCFGLNYVILKEIVNKLPPMAWASFRIAVATCFFFLFCFLSGRPRPKFNREFLLPLAIYSLGGTILNQSSFILGLSYTTATNSAILNSLIPLATLFIVTVRGQEKFTWNRAIGFLFALFGVLALRGIENFNIKSTTVLGDALTLFNCVVYGIFLSYSKKFFEKNDPLWSGAFLFLYGTIGIGLLAIPQWRQVDFSMDFTPMLSRMIFSIGFGTVTAYYLNFWALRHAQASRVALFINLQPIIAGIFSWVWMGEVVTLRMIFASLFIFSGMMIALSDPSRILVFLGKRKSGVG